MIAIVLGTKAELIKTIPIIKELDRQNIRYTLIHTGQHPIQDLLDDFNIKQLYFKIFEPPKKSSRFMTKVTKALGFLILLVPKLTKALKEIKPKYVLYHGDTLSSTAGAVASWLSHSQGIHLEGGLRSGNIFEPFPEEISRRVCDYFSKVLFTPSDLATKNVQKYKNKTIIQVGNTINDSIKLALQNYSPQGNISTRQPYILVNIHRHENIKSKKRLSIIVDIINTLAEQDRNITWCIHDNTQYQINKFKLKISTKVTLLPLQPYIIFTYLLNHCNYIITDGGSISEECLFLKKHCIILRERTERQEGLKTPYNILTGLNQQKVLDAIAITHDTTFKNPYEHPQGKNTSEEIVRWLKQNG